MLASGLLWAAGTAAWTGITSGQHVAIERARSEHLQVTYPAAEAGKAASFLSYAEGVYFCVDSTFSGALPAVLPVTLVSGQTHGSSDSTVVVSLLHESLVGRSFARELAHVAGRAIVGPAYDLEGYRFLAEGLAAWAAERCGPVPGPAEPYWLWAAYAYMEEATYPEYLEAFERAVEEVGRSVVAAAGYAFVDHVVRRHGREGLVALLTAMSENIDVCSALDDADFGCDSFLDDWSAALDAEAAKHDFSLIPQIHADLFATGQGEHRELSLWVRIVNPEAESYAFYVSLVIDGERSEEPFYAEGSDFSGRVPLGEARVGAKVMWDVGVWSETLKLWRRSGWQDRIIE
jgi:hypothetical protein